MPRIEKPNLLKVMNFDVDKEYKDIKLKGLRIIF